jgi:GR25 family glycosyltransferase involved in LPS biosynthesis
MRLICSIFLLFFSFRPAEAAYRVEGFGNYYDHEERQFLMATFLPHNPTILALNSNPEIFAKCSKYWPQAPFFYLDSLDVARCHTFDLLWLDAKSDELEVLSQARDLLDKASLVYTSTHLEGNGIDFQHIKNYLEFTGFTFLTHWYWENEKGNALFLREDMHKAIMRTLSYTPTGFIPTLGPPFLFEPLLHPVKSKSDEHRMEEIDFIYMINLDKRPEKFAHASNELQLYGISPYRFSAVNGWELPVTVFDQIGVKFAPGSLQEQFLGSSYLEEDGREYIDTEFLQENGRAYFTWYLARGAIGIVLSHLSILQDAYDSGYQTIWVMEDDVEVLEDPRQIPGLIRGLDQLAPDWDILFTDVDTKDTQGVHVPCRALAARPNVPLPPLTTFFEKFYAIGNNFYRTGMRYGAYSMILRRSGVQKILDYYRKYRVFIPYDMDYWLCPDLKMFYFNRDIVSHRAGAPSDNNKPRYSINR